MDEEPKLVFSLLCRRIKRKRTSVRVHIYKLEHERGWTLEVEDQAGGSTVWDEKFNTDEAALDEVMNVIETDGIETFLADPDKPTLHWADATAAHGKRMLKRSPCAAGYFGTHWSLQNLMKVTFS